jgi:hypothetical protein
MAIEKHGLIRPGEGCAPLIIVASEQSRNLSSSWSVFEVETAPESIQRVHSRDDCLPLDSALWD